MGIIKIFFLLPSKGKFLQNFASNDQLKAQAEQVWRQLDGLSLLLLIITAIFGIGLAIYYYTGYNEMPGRHYKIKHWGIWAFIAFIFSLIVTTVIEYVCIKTNIKTGLASTYWLCAINNALYCFILYLSTSVVWCNFFRTNAFKFLKI
ncbi:membrane protein [gut metagenome]|uniref:Membrane protein n=1 Tax=gut metagenome TaxID=749906 RepID=J9GQT2_9ZZZZ